MPDLDGLSRALMLAGIVIFAVGLGLALGDRVPFLGRLPGDLQFRRGGTTFYFPIATCVVLSVIGSLVLWLINRR